MLSIGRSSLLKPRVDDVLGKVFISHITEEAPIAAVLKKFIEAKFLNQLSVFVSSEIHDLPPGVRWFQKIEEALTDSDLMLIICSPSSLTRPWINFEAGCGWIQRKNIIPLCHSGQTKGQLPYPFSELQAIDLEESVSAEHLISALCNQFGILSPPENLREFHKQLVKAAVFTSVASPQVIHSLRQRTELINQDLEKLLNSANVAKQTVWTSAFLSSFAIGADDLFPDDQREYLKLLLKERDLLLSLARKGCNIKCIISPANANHLLHSGINYAVRRTKRLLGFLTSGDRALNSIDWTVSEVATRNLYVIGHTSCFEGYTRGIQQGYGLTLRQTSPEVIKAHIELYSGFFKGLAARSLAKWTNEIESEKGTSERQLLRIATTHCLERSLDFLDMSAKAADT
jgi:hypothetical protein